MTTATTAIVFSCDEPYFFLARGLVLSLAAEGYPKADTKLILIDIGCGPASQSWMEDHGVEIMPFNPALIPQNVMSVVSPVQRAQVVRPWLPDLLPQYEHFVWLDCDLWVQNDEFMIMMRAGAKMAPDAVVLAPGLSSHNQRFYVGIDRLLAMQRLWFESCYPSELVDKISNTLHYSSGVFGMRRTSPVWALWREEIKFIYPAMATRTAKNKSLMHLAEQIALNVVVFRSGLFRRLDPLYNFHCNAGGAARAPNGRVVTMMMLPSREIGVIHLANWSAMYKHYLSQNLLYRSGDYLSPAERTALAG
jgi:hypothetical protein